jgi:predicted O-methyltransferase YrrM
MGVKLSVMRHRVFYYARHQVSGKRKGHGVHSPFVYSLCENVFYNQHAHYDFSRLERVRESLLRNDTQLNCGDFGAGSLNFKSNTRKVRDIAQKGISSRKQSEILYRLCNFLKAESCLELGTSLGLNTLYLALQNPSGRVITLEGSGELSAFANQLAEKNTIKNVHYKTGRFDELLGESIRELKGNVLVYVDGDHTYESTLRYFEKVLPLAQGNNVMVFDDIYWSPGMTRAWQEIIKHPAVRLSIDTYYSGYLFFREEFREKGHFRIVL